MVDKSTEAIKSAWEGAKQINEEYQVTTKVAEGLKEYEVASLKILQT